jgi:hypothetical protein
MEDIPELELTEEGQQAMEAGEFYPLEGLGRMGGVELLWKEMEVQKKNMEVSLKKLKEVKGKIDHSAEIHQLEWEVAYITQWQMAKCQWGFWILKAGELVSVDVIIWGK